MKNKRPSETFNTHHAVIASFQEALDTLRMHGPPPLMSQEESDNLVAWLGHVSEVAGPEPASAMQLAGAMLVKRFIEAYGTPADPRH